MAAVLAIGQIGTLGIMGFVLGMGFVWWFWAVVALTVVGTQVSLYVAYRSWDVPTPRQ